MEYNQDLPRENKKVRCWGHKDLPKQKGLITYGLSANQQRPFAGAGHNAIFNVSRRVKNQILYVAPPFIVAYLIIDWAEKRNKFLNSKPGRIASSNES